MSDEPRYDTLVKKMSEWVWKRCPGCGRTSKHAGDPRYPNGDYHSDGCPLEGMYGHRHQWWFEREIERLERGE